MRYALGLNVWGPEAKWVGPGAKGDVPWGKMGYALAQNGLSPGAKWDAPWGKMGFALGLNGLGPEAKLVGPWV